MQGVARGGGVSIHHPDAEPGRHASWEPERSCKPGALGGGGCFGGLRACAGGSAGADRGRTRGPRPRPYVPATPAAHAWHPTRCGRLCRWALQSSCQGVSTAEKAELGPCIIQASPRMYFDGWKVLLCILTAKACNARNSWRQSGLHTELSWTLTAWLLSGFSRRYSSAVIVG
jgi:hypothetical protein